MDDLTTTAGNVLAFVSLALALACVIAYATKTRGAWRLTEIGRHLMAFMAAVAAVLTASVLRIILVDVLDHADPLIFKMIRVLTFATVPVVLGWRLKIILQATPDKEGDHDHQRS